MKIREHQSKFLLDIAKLIIWANEQKDISLTLGDGYRDPRVFGMYGDAKGYGSAKSNHKLRLAMDLNLFIKGEYSYSTEEHRFLGKKWESMDSSNRWGGKYNDGNHYERVI